MTENIIKWLASGATGSSSKTMALAALGQEYKYNSHPLDPADLNRCIKLVDDAPEVKDAFPRIAKLSKEWAIVIENWDMLRQLFVHEVGYDWSMQKTAPKTYYKMKELKL